MPRPLSWLPRLAEIRRSITNSVRSHYNRRDLELLFELQPRASGKLLALLPTVQVGNARLVAREALLRYVEQVGETEDVAGLRQQLERERGKKSRSKIRGLVRDDVQPVELGEISLPSNLLLYEGRVTIGFHSLDQLCEAMVALCRVVESDSFRQKFVPAAHPAISAELEESRRIQREIERMRADHARRQTQKNPPPPVKGEAEPAFSS